MLLPKSNERYKRKSEFAKCEVEKCQNFLCINLLKTNIFFVVRNVAIGSPKKKECNISNLVMVWINLLWLNFT